MDKRQAVKSALMVDPKRKSMRSTGKVYACEGQAYMAHDCAGGLDMNEVLYPRSVFQKLPEHLKEYFWDPINCALNCGYFHERYGHTKEYEAWHRARVEKLYGRRAVADYLARAPLKEKKG